MTLGLCVCLYNGVCTMPAQTKHPAGAPKGRQIRRRIMPSLPFLIKMIFYLSHLVPTFISKPHSKVPPEEWNLFYQEHTIRSSLLAHQNGLWHLLSLTQTKFPFYPPNSQRNGTVVSIFMWPVCITSRWCRLRLWDIRQYLTALAL